MSDLTPVPDPPPEPLATEDLLRRLLARTPARLLTSRAGPGYRTVTSLHLRADHAVARDAVYADLDLIRAFGAERAAALRLFSLQTQAATKHEYLMRPDLGRKLDDASRARLIADCPSEVDLQVFLGDGLSAQAVEAQAPSLLDRLTEIARVNGRSFGRTFAVRHCRVGVMNDVGDLLRPQTVVLLIGERPGLATAESLSAYAAYRPRSGHTDADRNLISNIHARGVSIEAAAERIFALTEAMRAAGRSGVGLSETT